MPSVFTPQTLTRTPSAWLNAAPVLAARVEILGRRARRETAVREGLGRMVHHREARRREHQMREALLQVDRTDRVARVAALDLEAG